jgi:hypothetical protein
MINNYMSIKELLLKWWFWLTIITIILVAFFYPKSCGYYGGVNPQGVECSCIGAKTDYYMNTVCYGICLKDTCNGDPTFFDSGKRE